MLSLIHISLYRDHIGNLLNRLHIAVLQITLQQGGAIDRFGGRRRKQRTRLMLQGQRIGGLQQPDAGDGRTVGG